MLDAQVKRLLADERAEVLVTDFAEHWLNVDDLDAVQPDKQLFPEFTEGVRQDFAEEIKLFLSSILLEDQNVQTLLTADHTSSTNASRAATGCRRSWARSFGASCWTDKSRHGLLGKGAVLLRTSYGDRTSPVLRGAWVLDKLMGTPPTPPPPGVETDLATPGRAADRRARAPGSASRESNLQGLSRRHRSARSRAGELQAPAAGATRQSGRAPIDATTELSSGIKLITGPTELRSYC